MEASLNRMYADREKIPADMRMGDEKTMAFCAAMMGAWKKSGGQQNR